MRFLLSIILVLALAVPAVSLAGSQSSSSATGATVTAKADKKKNKKKTKKARKAKQKSQRATRTSGSSAGDEREVKGPLTSLSPATVGTVVCQVPAGMTLAGFKVGDFVEMTCDLRAGSWTLRKIKHEDDGVAGGDEREVKGHSDVAFARDGRHGRLRGARQHDVDRLQSR